MPSSDKAPTPAALQRKVYRRIDAIIEKTEPLTPDEQNELHSLGRLAATLDDLKYRRTHSSGAYSKAEEKHNKGKKRGRK